MAGRQQQVAFGTCPPVAMPLPIVSESHVTFTCRYPGCGKVYSTSDGARKHARNHHPEWLKNVEIQKRSIDAYCIRTEGMLPQEARQQQEQQQRQQQLQQILMEPSPSQLLQQHLQPQPSAMLQWQQQQQQQQQWQPQWQQQHALSTPPLAATCSMPHAAAAPPVHAEAEMREARDPLAMSWSGLPAGATWQSLASAPAHRIGSAIGCGGASGMHSGSLGPNFQAPPAYVLNTAHAQAHAQPAVVAGATAIAPHPVLSHVQPAGVWRDCTHPNAFAANRYTTAAEAAKAVQAQQARLSKQAQQLAATQATTTHAAAALATATQATAAQAASPHVSWVMPCSAAPSLSSPSMPPMAPGAPDAPPPPAELQDHVLPASRAVGFPRDSLADSHAESEFEQMLEDDELDLSDNTREFLEKTLREMRERDGDHSSEKP